MVRTANESDPERIHDLQDKIENEEYLDTAIFEIARVLTEEIIMLEDNSHEQY